MDAQNGIQFLIVLFQQGLIDGDDIIKAIEIAGSKSPSASVALSERHFAIKYTGRTMSSLSYGKGVRWLAMIRRDEGQDAFELKIAELQLLIQGGLRLKSDETIIDRFDSHLHAGVITLLPEALAKINSLGRQFLVEEIDFGRMIGNSVCVATQPGDEIVFAKRPKRFGPTRFVKNRQPEPCSSIVVILKKINSNTYELVTAFIGKRPEPEPWDTRFFSQQVNPFETERNSREFWSSHALIWGSEPIISGTETKVSPW